MVSEAQKRAKDRYEEKAYWKILVRFPKGLEEEIRKQPMSINGFIVEAVMEKLARETGSDLATMRKIGKRGEPNFNAIEPIKPKEMPEYLKMALSEMP